LPGYTLPDGQTLKNKLRATSLEALEVAEAEYVQNRIIEIEFGRGPTRNFDVTHFKAIHRHLFQDVYEWAGHTRDARVTLSDGTIATEPFLRKIDGKPFMEGPLIAGALDRIARTLADENYLRGLTREEFASRAADVMVDLNAIHPFREGNGRTQRIFMEALANEAGHKLDFSVVSRERMIQASIQGNENDDARMMRRLFAEISHPERVAALTKAIAALEQHGFAWNDSYIATAEPGHKVDVRLAGIAGDQFMARTRTAILIGRARDLPIQRPTQAQEFTVFPREWDDAQKAAARTNEAVERSEPRSRMEQDAYRDSGRDEGRGR
jgi:cell filamentation protein